MFECAFGNRWADWDAAVPAAPRRRLAVALPPSPPLLDTSTTRAIGRTVCLAPYWCSFVPGTRRRAAPGKRDRQAFARGADYGSTRPTPATCSHSTAATAGWLSRMETTGKLATTSSRGPT